MYDRSKTIGASDAVHIQKGDWAALYDAKQSQDDPQYGLAAEIGKVLEPFNLELFVRQTGLELITSADWQQNPYQFQDAKWCTFLPDGLLDEEAWIPVEAKCINMMWNPVNLLTKYMPQLQHAMRVMGAPYCYFSVLYLNTRFEVTKIDYDPPYDLALFEKEKLFYWFLEKNIRPPEYTGKRKGWV